MGEPKRVFCLKTEVRLAGDLSRVFTGHHLGRIGRFSAASPSLAGRMIASLMRIESRVEAAIVLWRMARSNDGIVGPTLAEPAATAIRRHPRKFGHALLRV